MINITLDYSISILEIDDILEDALAQMLPYPYIVDIELLNKGDFNVLGLATRKI